VTGELRQPTDIDGNGRVIMFYTRAVNELTPRGGLCGRRLRFRRATCSRSRRRPAARRVRDEQHGGDVLHAGAGPGGYGERQRAHGGVRAAHERGDAGARVPAPDQRGSAAVRHARLAFEACGWTRGSSHIAEELVYYRSAGRCRRRQNLAARPITATQAAGRRVQPVPVGERRGGSKRSWRRRRARRRFGERLAEHARRDLAPAALRGGSARR
jgi:hypothetical protein